MKTKKKYLLLSLILLVLVLSAAIGSSMAYFTSYVTAKGGQPIKLGSKTSSMETYESGLKKITITSEEGSVPVYVRAKAFCSSDEHTLRIYGTNWQQDVPEGWTAAAGDEDYWYYTAQVDGGMTSEILNVAISNLEDNDPEFEPGDSFSVVVVYESTPVRYTEAGDPYADWTLVLDNGSSEGGND